MKSCMYCGILPPGKIWNRRSSSNCDDVDEDEEPIDTSDSEESVQSMILGLLAMALVPTILGGLLIAYRIQW